MEEIKKELKLMDEILLEEEELYEKILHLKQNIIYTQYIKAEKV